MVTQLDNVVNTFSSFGAVVQNLAAVFSTGITMNHQFTGDMKLAFNIENGDVLKSAIAESMTPVIVNTITQEIDRRLNPNDFKAA